MSFPVSVRLSPGRRRGEPNEAGPGSVAAGPGGAGSGDGMHIGPRCHHLLLATRTSRPQGRGGGL